MKKSTKVSKVSFWRDMFLYFWFFSLIGHIVELIWGILGVAIGFKTWEAFLTIPIFAVAIPYGFGAVALLLTLYPLFRNKKINVATAFVLSALITTAIEFICALGAVLIFGSNPFWDYSNYSFNLFGFICLQNSLLFGLGSLVMLRYLFPLSEKILQRVKGKYVWVTFWILFVGYIAVQIARFTIWR